MLAEVELAWRLKLLQLAADRGAQLPSCRRFVRSLRVRSAAMLLMQKDGRGRGGGREGEQRGKVQGGRPSSFFVSSFEVAHMLMRCDPFATDPGYPQPNPARVKSFVLWNSSFGPFKRVANQTKINDENISRAQTAKDGTLGRNRNHFVPAFSVFR